MGQSSGVLFKEVSAFQRCPLVKALLHRQTPIDHDYTCMQYSYR